MQKLQTILLLLLMTNIQGKAQTTDTTKEERFTVHAQSTVISQTKLKFAAPYTGDNSLLPSKENQTSLTATLYLGARLWKGGSLYINPEIAGGSGLSQALGIADATNGETFRIGDPSPKIYLARLFFQQIFSLDKNTTYQESDFNQLAKKVPTKYIAVTVGKISISDIFDDNRYSHDPRTQFFSWGLMGNGAWDYPANTRGYTPSVVLEYITEKNELRYGFSLLPKSANGNDMNWQPFKSNAQMVEYAHHYSISNKKGTVRLLAFLNTAPMGNYRQAIAASAVDPNIVSTRADGRTKYGFALNAEQELVGDLGCFARASWNDGKNETWAFTEIDRSISAGLSLQGNSWHRANDNIGLAFVTSGLSKDHRAYLAAGGKGFILGDGQLNYSWEKLGEVFYSAEISKDHIYLTGAYQIVINPGYNKDRSGPVNVFSVRLHTKI